MHQFTVRDVATAEVVTVAPATPFKDVVDILQNHQISGLPVVDGDGRVLGVVSEVDLVLKETHRRPRWPATLLRPAARRKATGTTAADLATAPPVTISPERSVEDAARLLSTRGVRRLIVADDDGTLVGMVCPKDLLRVFLRSDDDIAAQIRRDVFERGLWVTVTPATVTIEVHDGVVTLSGQVERKSMVPAAVAMARQVDGVVDVVDHLGFITDDTHTIHAETSDAAMKHESWTVRSMG